MYDEKCAELAVKLAAVQELLNQCYIRGLPDHLEAEHVVLVREFNRLTEKWNALRCEVAESKPQPFKISRFYDFMDLIESTRPIDRKNDSGLPGPPAVGGTQRMRTSLYDGG